MGKMVKKEKVIICYLCNTGKFLKLSGFPFLCKTEGNNAFFLGLLQKLNVKLQAQCLEYDHVPQWDIWQCVETLLAVTVVRICYHHLVDNEKR